VMLKIRGMSTVENFLTGFNRFGHGLIVIGRIRIITEKAISGPYNTPFTLLQYIPEYLRLASLFLFIGVLIPIGINPFDSGFTYVP